MKLTKENLQKIIQEEIENLMSEEDDLKTRVRALSDGGEMSTVGITLPSWLISGKPTKLDKLKAEFPGLKNLKPAELKKALGIGTEESEYEKRMKLLQKGK